MSTLNADPGTYALILSCTIARTIAIGKLGLLSVRPGFYVYAGSAFGPGGLAARVARHRRAQKRLRWHVDYLRAVTDLEEVWYTLDATRRECTWAEAFSRMHGATVPLDGFGASDCPCRSHLFHFSHPPSRRRFSRRVRGLAADHGAVRCVRADGVSSGKHARRSN